MSTPARDIFTTLADPTRRRIIELLAERELTAGAVAREFEISRPAVAKHLRILREGGIVAVRRVGRQRVNRLEPLKLREPADWLHRVERFWEGRLERLKREVESAYRADQEDRP